MPAQSQQQQKLFGLALSVKRGETPRSEASKEVLDIVNSMTEKQIEDFAGTSHSGLPKKVESALRELVRNAIKNNESVNEAKSLDDMMKDANRIKKELADAQKEYSKSKTETNKAKVEAKKGQLERIANAIRNERANQRESVNEHNDCGCGCGGVTEGGCGTSVNESQLKGLEGIPPTKKLKDLTDEQKLKIIQSPGNIIDFKVPDYLKGKRNFYQVISKGKIIKKKNISGDTIFFVAGGGLMNSPAYSSVKELINNVLWDSMEDARKFNQESVNEALWPKSKLPQSFQFALAPELKKNFKGIFYSVGNDIYHNDKKVLTVDNDKDSVNSIIKQLKSKIKESVNEAKAVGKKIFSDAKGKLFFGYQNDDDSVHLVDYKTWKKLSMKDLSNEFMANRIINSIVRNERQFNKKVDYNMWSKKTNPSFEDRMDYFIKNGWISNITKAGIRESVESINESASRTAMEIGGLTGMNKDAVQKFVDTHNLDIEKLFQYVKKGKFKERMDFVSAVVGNPGNKIQKMIISKFGIKESVNESSVEIGDNVFLKSQKKIATVIDRMGRSVTVMTGDGKRIKTLINNIQTIVEDNVNEASNEIYFKTATEAVAYARTQTEKRGFQIDDEDWHSQITMGGRYSRTRPSVGKTHSFSVGLLKGGKPQRKNLNISLYGMESGKFELTFYIN
jgi:hypothetical protein